MSDEVNWPDGDRRLHGKAQISQYWTEQWARIHTSDVPAVVATLSDSVRVVRIDQVVHAPTGRVVSLGTFAHVLHLDGRLIARLDIVPLSSATFPLNSL